MFNRKQKPDVGRLVVWLCSLGAAINHSISETVLSGVVARTNVLVKDREGGGGSTVFVPSYKNINYLSTNSLLIDMF